jgi:hypothetical protein
MRWIEAANVSLLLAVCSLKTRPRVACRHTAAPSWVLSPRARYGDSLHINPFHPARGGRSGSWRRNGLQPLEVYIS